MSLGQEPGDWRVPHQPALVEVDLENIRAMLGKGDDGFVVELIAIVEFQLLGHDMLADGGWSCQREAVK